MLSFSFSITILMIAIILVFTMAMFFEKVSIAIFAPMFAAFVFIITGRVFNVFGEEMTNFFTFDFYEILVWVATLTMWLIALICRRYSTGRIGGIGQPLAFPLAVILPIIFFTIMAGFRKNVGDTYYYQHSYELMPVGGNAVDLKTFFEGSFSFFQNLFRNLGADFTTFLMFSAILSIPIPLIILYKYSYPFDLSLYLFVTIGYFGGMMNGMRQYMAAAIVLLGTKYLFSLQKGSFFKYAIFVFFAYFMHSSALIMLPIYWVVRRKAWKSSSYLLLAGSVLVMLLFNTFLPSFLGVLEDTSYNNYVTTGWFTNGEEAGSSIFRVLFALLPIIISYINREQMKRLDHIGDILINIGFVNAAIYIISMYNWIFARFAIYLMAYSIIFITWSIYNAVKPSDRTAYYLVCMIFFFIYSRQLSYQISAYESDYFFPGRKLF